MATLNATPANFASVLSSAAAGDTILCADGTYVLGGITKAVASELVIKAENKWGAIFNSMELNSCAYLTFDGIEFTGNVNPDGKSFITRGSHHCAFYRNKIGSLNSRYCNNMTAKYNWFTCESGGSTDRLGLQLERGLDGNYDWLIECNLFRGENAVPINDYIQLQDSWNVTIHRNTFYDLGISYFSGTSGQYAHVDFIQIYAIDNQCDNITVTDNWIYDDYSTQQDANGIWSMPLNANATNLTVTGNIMVTGSSNGMFITGPDETTLIDGNLVLPWPASLPNVSNNGGVIRLNGGGSATVTNNATTAITNTSTTVPADNVIKTKVEFEADLDFTNQWADIADYEPSVFDYDGQAWLTRLTGILDGSQDFYAPDGTLQMGGTVAPPTILGTISGMLTLEITVQ